MTVILIVIGVIIAALLAGLMFMRETMAKSEVQIVDWANQLPANDAVANSMYGGAQEIFQQPVATPAPAVAQQVPQVHLRYQRLDYRQAGPWSSGRIRPPIPTVISLNLPSKLLWCLPNA